LRANDLGSVLEERLESGVKERLRHGDYLESNSGIRQCGTGISERQGLYLESSNELCKVRIETYFGL
jgi:hypothetical protein